MGLLGDVFKVLKSVFMPVLDVLDWLAPSIPGQDRTALSVQREGSNVNLPVVYGEGQKVGGIIVHKYVTDQDGGAKNDTLNLIVAFCEGEIEEIGTLYFDDVSETDPKFGGLISTEILGVSVSLEYDWLKINKHTGVAGEAADADAVANIPNWTAESHRMSGVAYCFVQLRMDKNQEVWRGEPKIHAIIKGKKVLDTRTGVTAASSNPAMCLRDYVTNKIYGRGLSESRVDDAAFNAAADFCDEGVTVTETISNSFYDDELKEYVNLPPSTNTLNIPRFTTNIIIDTEAKLLENTKELLGCFRGIMPPEYVLSPKVEREEDIITTFDNDTIIGGVSMESGSINDRYNRVTVKYPSKLSNYETEEVSYPNIDDDIYQTWLEEDGGKELEKSFTYNGITNKGEALQMAEVLAKRSRFNTTVSIKTQAIGIIYSVGDVIGLTHETMGWIDKPFRIAQKTLSPEGEVSFSLREHENNVYPWNDQAYSDREGGTYLGDPSYIDAPVDLQLIPDLTLATTGELVWNDEVSNRFIDRYRVIITRTDTDEEILADDTRGHSYTVPLLDAGEYGFLVYSVATLGNISNGALLTTTLSIPNTPSALTLESADFQIRATPTLNGIGLGTTFEFDVVLTSESTGYTPESKGRGQTFVASGLLPDTDYTVYCRTINAIGVSSWINNTTKTTDKGDQLDIFLDPIWEAIDNTNTNVDDLLEDIESNLDEIILIRNEVDGQLRPQLNTEIINRQETDRELFNTTASLAQFKRATENFESDITNAVFEVDPDSGTLSLRAYNYTDESFSQASLLIDGVSAEVNIQAGRITELDGAVQDANAEINVLAGEIELKASYTEMTEYVSESLDAIIPAYSFGFFNSAEGWVAVNGAITPGTNKMTATWGDIENTSLNYSADDNPVITITCKRLSGTDSVGDLIVTFSGGSTQTYTGVIEDSQSGTINVKNLNLAGESTYTGTVTGLRIILGESVADEFEFDSITIGKPSAQLEALDGLTAQVNQLGVDLDAVEGQLTSFVTTTYYDENTVTLNNVTQVLDGEDVIISLTATQQELNDEGTITKANSASLWVDGADANIRSSVVNFNAEEGGIDDQIEGLQGILNTVEQELSTIDGASIRSQLLSINELEIESGDLAELQFYTELKLLDQRNNALEIGNSVATVDQQVKAVSDEAGALAQDITLLQASTGTIQGQVNANVSNIAQAQTDIDGNAQAIIGLTTEVENAQGDIADAQLTLDSTVDELGEVSSRAYFGVSTTVEDGKRDIAGVTFDSVDSGIRFKGDIFELATNDDKTALFYDADVNEWKFNGRLIVGGYAINSEEDIRGLDGETIYEVYRYSVNGVDNWHNTMQTGDIFRQTATVENGIQGSWSASARIAGFNGEDGQNGESAYNLYSDTGNISLNGIAYTKVGSEGWDASLASEESYQAAASTFNLDSARRAMAGLSTQPVGGDYQLMDYAIYGSLSQILIYESGDNIDYGNSLTHRTSDKLSVVCDGDSVRYLKNGVTFYVSSKKPTSSYMFSVCAFDAGSILYNAAFLPNGYSGARGAGRYETATSTGAWSQSVAESILPDGTPVDGDIVTITKFDDPTVSNTRKYEAGVWTAYALIVNGNALIDGSVDGGKFNSASTITAGAGGDSVTLDGTGGGYVFYTGINASAANTRITESGILEAVGAKFATAGSGQRVEIEDDGTYLIWVGTGAKTDSNATFFIKKNGTGFVSGSFFAGQIIETKFNQGTDSATITHASAGNDVELTINSNGSGTVIANNAPSPAGASTYTLPYTVKRDSTTLEGGNIIVTRVVEFEAGEYTTRDYYNFSTTVVDTGTSSASYTYTVEVGTIPLSTATEKTSIRSYEDLLTS